MKLLFNENLSDRLVERLQSLYPGSAHVKAFGLVHTDDALIWEFAKRHGYAITSKDADFHQRSLLYGAPPKFIFLRVGNCSTAQIVQRLPLNHELLAAFCGSADTSLLVLD